MVVSLGENGNHGTKTGPPPEGTGYAVAGTEVGVTDGAGGAGGVQRRVWRAWSADRRSGGPCGEREPQLPNGCSRTGSKRCGVGGNDDAPPKLARSGFAAAFKIDGQRIRLPAQLSTLPLQQTRPAGFTSEPGGSAGLRAAW